MYFFFLLFFPTVFFFSREYENCDQLRPPWTKRRTELYLMPLWRTLWRTLWSWQTPWRRPPAVVGKAWLLRGHGGGQGWEGEAVRRDSHLATMGSSALSSDRVALGAPGGCARQRARAGLQPRWGGKPDSGSSRPSARGDGDHIFSSVEKMKRGCLRSLGLPFFQKISFSKNWYFSKTVLENCYFSKQFWIKLLFS